MTNPDAPFSSDQIRYIADFLKRASIEFEEDRLLDMLNEAREAALTTGRVNELVPSNKERRDQREKILSLMEQLKNEIHELGVPETARCLGGNANAIGVEALHNGLARVIATTNTKRHEPLEVKKGAPTKKNASLRVYIDNLAEAFKSLTGKEPPSIRYDGESLLSR